MSKGRTSLSLDDDVLAYLQQDSVNASGLVNQLVRNHMAGGDQDETLLRVHREQLQEEVESHERAAERKRTLLKHVEESIETTEEKQSRIIAQAANTLEPQMLDVENPATRNWAQKAGMEPEEFVTTLEERL